MGVACINAVSVRNEWPDLCPVVLIEDERNVTETCLQPGELDGELVA